MPHHQNNPQNHFCLSRVDEGEAVGWDFCLAAPYLCSLVVGGQPAGQQDSILFAILPFSVTGCDENWNKYGNRSDARRLHSEDGII